MESITNHAFIAAIAMLLHALLMVPEHFRQRAVTYGIYHTLSRAFHFLEKKLNRSSRTSAERDMRGSVVVAVVVLGALLMGWLLELLIPENSFGIVLQLLILVSSLNVRQSIVYGLKVKEYIDHDDILAAKQCFVGSCFRSYSMMDGYGLVRSSIERILVNTCTKCVAPILFYTFFGLTGLMLSVAIVVLAECYTPYREHFGRVALEIERWVLWIPARLTALLLILATACLPIGSPFKAMWALFTDSLKLLPRPLLLHVGSVMLNLSLGGALSPHADDRQWTGDGPPQPQTSAITRTALVSGVALLILLLLELALAF